MRIRHSAGAAALLAATLALTACSDGGEATDDPSASTSAGASADATAPPEPTAEDVAALEAVEVAGEVGEDPELTFSDLTVSVPTTRVVDEGDGAAVAPGMVATVDFVTYDGAGERHSSTWEMGTPQSIPVTEAATDPLNGASVGSRILLASPTYDAENNPVTVVNLIEIVDAKEARAEGEPVEPAEGLPTVTLAEDGAPSIEIPDGYEAPDDLVAQTLIKGDGAEVTPEQTITAQYTGWTLDGEVFDSSWESGRLLNQPLQGLIPGWIEGLSGQTVGSQVLLVIPAEQAYGEKSAENTSELAGEDLIFVLDILAAS